MNNEKLKILFSIRQANFGGGETHLKYIFTFLEKNIFDPILVSYTQGYLFDFANEKGIQTFLMKNGLVGFAINSIRIINLIKKFDIKFIHGHGTRGTLQILIPAIVTNRKFIYTVHSWSFHYGLSKLNFLIRKWIEKIICHFAEYVIFISSSDLDKAKFVKPQKRILIDNGVDTEKFKPSTDTYLRQIYQLSRNDFVIGYVGRFTFQKNPLFVIDIINKLVNHYKIESLKTLMFGDGELKKVILQKINEYQLNDFIKVLPASENLENVFPIFDCLVHPTHWEGLSFSILEAMSCGVPCIISEQANESKIISDYENGLVAKIDNLDSFCIKIIELIKHESLRKKLSENARNTILQNYRIEDKIQKLFQIYLETK